MTHRVKIQSGKREIAGKTYNLVFISMDEQRARDFAQELRDTGSFARFIRGKGKAFLVYERKK